MHFSESKLKMKLPYCAIDFYKKELYGEFENNNPLIGPKQYICLVKYKNQISDNPQGYIRYIDNEKENTTHNYVFSVLTDK